MACGAGGVACGVVGVANAVVGVARGRGQGLGEWSEGVSTHFVTSPLWPLSPRGVASGVVGVAREVGVAWSNRCGQGGVLGSGEWSEGVPASIVTSPLLLLSQRGVAWGGRWVWPGAVGVARGRGQGFGGVVRRCPRPIVTSIAARGVARWV